MSNRTTIVAVVMGCIVAIYGAVADDVRLLVPGALSVIAGIVLLTRRHHRPKDLPSGSSIIGWGIATLLAGLAFIGFGVAEVAGVTSGPAPTRFIFAAVSLLIGAFFSVIGYGVTYFATTGRKSKLVAPTTRVARALIADRRFRKRRPG